jgi:hypothetical protein
LFGDNLYLHLTNACVQPEGNKYTFEKQTIFPAHITNGVDLLYSFMNRKEYMYDSIKILPADKLASSFHDSSINGIMVLG